MAYDPMKAHNAYIHKRNSQYYKMLYVISIAAIVEENGCDYPTARKIYFNRVNQIKEYANCE